MRKVLSRSILTAAATTGAVAIGAGCAQADAHAEGGGSGSPGVLSGNSVEVPVDAPVNVCGNTADVVGLVNPAFGNACTNGTHPHPAAPDRSDSPSSGGTSTSDEPPRNEPPRNDPEPPSGEPEPPSGGPAEPSLPESIVPEEVPSAREGNGVSETHPAPPRTPQDQVRTSKAVRADVETGGFLSEFDYTPRRATTPLFDERTSAGYYSGRSESPAEGEFGWFSSPVPTEHPAQPRLARTGSDGVDVATASAAALGLVLGGALLYRRPRVHR